MKSLLLNFLLAVLWIFLSGEFNFENLLEGFLVGFIVIWIGKYASKSNNYFGKTLLIIKFFFYFIYELFIANIRVAKFVLMRREKMKPGIIAVPLSAEKDFEIVLLSNIITLTPGTLTLDISPDKKVIYVHSMYVTNPEDFRREIKEGFEKRILEITR